MVYFIALVIEGILHGAVYALIALAFVVVYKSTRIINFALGDWLASGARLVAAPMHALDWGLLPSLLAGLAGLGALALVFCRLVLQHMIARPLSALLLVTIGAGAVLRGGTSIALAGVPTGIPFSLASESWTVTGVIVPQDKALAAAFALLAVVLIAAFFRRTRSGLALRAIADDPQVATTIGIDVERYTMLCWAIMALVCIVTATLWVMISGSGFGLVLIGEKVFPIVILGGLDSIRGCLVAATVIGLLESLAAGYADPVLGSGFSSMCSYVLLIAVLFVRPTGLFGAPLVARV